MTTQTSPSGWWRRGFPRHGGIMPIPTSCLPGTHAPSQLHNAAHTTAISATIEHNLKAWEWARSATARHLYITACQELLSAITNCTASYTNLSQQLHLMQRALPKTVTKYSRLIAFIIQFRTIVIREDAIIKRSMFLSTTISAWKKVKFENLVKVVFGWWVFLLLPAFEAAGETEQKSLRLSYRAHLSPAHLWLV